MTANATPRPAPSAAGPETETSRPHVLVVEADCSLFGLLEEWLGAEGCAVEYECACNASTAQRVDLVIVDVPFPRQGGLELLQRIGQKYPGVPVVALSPTFFASVECAGAVARALGVASVLPKPLARDALATTVRALLKR
jgi:DNA-binding response OmpR family regulator